MGWISATTGWITGSIAIPNAVYLYRTQNGGVTWQAQSLPTPYPVQSTQPSVFFSATEGLLQIVFDTPQGRGFAVYATHDGGATWSSSSSLPVTYSVWVWDFVTMQQGWVVVGTNDSTLYQTSDGGLHWTLVTTSANFQRVSQLDFVSAQEGWAVSTVMLDAPVLLKTIDGGQTWAQVSPAPQAGSWRVVSSPDVGTSFNQLNSVAAINSSDIWAVGFYMNSANTSTLIEHWNGSSWQVVASPNVGTYNYLYGVAAISPTDAWAVGYAQDSAGCHPLIEHWNDTSWQVVSSPNAGTGSSQLNGVAALGTSNVWAVGYSEIGNGAYRHTLIEHWDGASWQIVPSPNPGTVYDVLNGVAALGVNNLWAVGYYTNSNGVSQNLIEQWNGTSWQVSSSLDVGSYGNQLNAVAAFSPSDIWMVGFYRTANGGTQTLVE